MCTSLKFFCCYLLSQSSWPRFHWSLELGSVLFLMVCPAQTRAPGTEQGLLHEWKQALASCTGIPAFASPFLHLFWRSENPSSEVELYSQNQSQRTEDVWNGLGFRDGQLWPNHLFLYLLSCPKILFNHSERDSLFPTFCFVLEQFWDEPCEF